ncbi:MAG TPA: FAD-binding protein [Pyrinomonadaceae bacterium]|nr:FAD-binding protein [Chloracidobacterium sp.]HRJ89860.1 FAD-binding protein [Pyrinomonadaceae bacterium]HRK51710.1 FAD-binding protein [Pyrinomonadaceae bacterium]
MSDYITYEHDVLVIGAGGAGLRAAIEASAAGVSVGTIVLSLNAILLAGYTFGCHSLRHLVGGGCDVLWDKPVRRGLWNWVSKLNRNHMLFAWMSLFWVGFSDFYVRMCSMGVFTDYRIF